ncbi:hypothetical protein QN362_05455 [Actimicrobium sp. CCC2.4]|uniref:hypothetical protein n=1 Tax=Actimicrobium sp. CCC2.4 TaxID=3048606 RepID=UPI002AC9533B|nr:hypothetical protein [Actimicrobium sp. CCC2.4]MEB0134773.1 hypothetical protein [Actimicrobium sp. CCC2.4]WPX30712.1 hypothetical protein RHM62_10540 [Actimicrobium sp. CCC2.4]
MHTPHHALLPTAKNRHATQEALADETGLPLLLARCLSREHAASYLGIGVTLLATLAIPCVRFGRRSVYDRLDLDAWLDNHKQRGRAENEKGLWPEKLVFTGGTIPDTSGLASPSPTASAYAKALGLKAAKRPKPTSPS